MGTQVAEALKLAEEALIPFEDDGIDYSRDKRTIAIRAALAAIRAAKPGWKPIESAPDGQKILIGRWVDLPGGRVWDRGEAYHNEYVAKVWTHWTELPEPPDEVAAKLNAGEENRG